MNPPWRVDTIQDRAAAAHAAASALVEPPGRVAGRVVRIVDTTDRAVVLGRAEPDSHIDAVRAARVGVSVVRRRSGGASVLVGPGQVVWVDLVVPAGDALWSADVGRAFWWLGRVWVDALAAAGRPGGECWTGALRTSRWSAQVCFAGLGPGEVTLGGAKVVGMSQRRTRSAALFQCAVPVTWDPVALVDVLALDGFDRASAAADLAGSAVGVGPDVARRLVPALLDRLS